MKGGGTVQPVRLGLAAVVLGIGRERGEGAVYGERGIWKEERGEAAGDGEDVKVDIPPTSLSSAYATVSDVLRVDEPRTPIFLDRFLAHVAGLQISLAGAVVVAAGACESKFSCDVELGTRVHLRIRRSTL